VRELENTLHRAVLLNNNGLSSTKPALLMEQPKTMEKLETGAGIEGLVGRTVSEVEKELILSTLGSVNNNRSKAAEIFGISIRTLHNKLKEYEQSQGAA
jgi:DNA-binding NtrC family response regulator